MADKTAEKEETHEDGGPTAMSVFQLIFTILSFLATIANLPLLILAYKRLLKKS